MRFMITFQNKALFSFVVTVLICSLVGCKRIGKEFSEKIIKDGAGETSEIIANKVAKSSLRNLSESSIRKLNYDDFILLLQKDFPIVYTSFSQLDKKFQENIVRTINETPKVLDVLLSSRTLLDEFVVVTNKVPVLAKNASFFSYYVTHPQFASDVVLKQKDNAAEFYSRVSNQLLGKYKDGVLEVIEPFAKNGRSFSSQILSGDLIPNTLYKVRGEMGTLYQFQTDVAGNVITALGRNIMSEDLVTNILRRNTDINLGTSWPASYKKLKQYSTGADLDVSIRFNYSENNPSPRSVKIVVHKGDKEVINGLFENSNHFLPIKYTSAQNSSLLSSLQKKLGISADKMTTLQDLMDADAGFAAFIHSNSEFNIKRWLRTRNHVDKKLIAKTPAGGTPKNAKIYAGNVYYFNPYLNPGLASRLSNANGLARLKKAGILSREQLEELDRLYPMGVPFSKSGFPDFSGVAAKGKDGAPIAINIGSLSGDSKVDIAKADALFQSQGNMLQDGFTWHHIEGTTSLLRVPTVIHQLIDHTGGMAMAK